MILTQLLDDFAEAGTGPATTAENRKHRESRILMILLFFDIFYNLRLDKKQAATLM